MESSHAWLANYPPYQNDWKWQKHQHPDPALCTNIPLAFKPTLIDMSQAPNSMVVSLIEGKPGKSLTCSWCKADSTHVTHITNMVASLIEGQTWQITNMSSWCNNDIIEEITKSKLDINQKHDKWIWKDGSNGIHITKSVYRSLFQYGQQPKTNTWKGWKLLWNLKVTPKNKIFRSKLLHNKLPTRSRLSKLGITDTAPCVLCSKEETSQNLFFNCDYIQQIWNILSKYFDRKGIKTNSWANRSWLFTDDKSFLIPSLILKTF